MVGQALARLEDLYRRGIAARDLRVALMAQRELVGLFGLPSSVLPYRVPQPPVPDDGLTPWQRDRVARVFLATLERVKADARALPAPQDDAIECVQGSGTQGGASASKGVAPARVVADADSALGSEPRRATR